jgi:DNA primase
MNNVKNISIKGFLAGRGIVPKQERGGYGMYLSPLREERTPSFKVDYGQNLWYDFGLGDGGSIIDLVARMDGCTVGEAIRRLENDVPGANSFPSHRDTPVLAQRAEPEKPRIEIVSVGELKHPALMEYLTGRGIESAAARKYCNEVRYSIDGREYFAIGFSNDAGGWELRNRSFKGSSTPKNITTIRGRGDCGMTTVRRDSTTGVDFGIGTTPANVGGSDTVMVFEGFIDFLSYLSLKANPVPTIDTAVLNSVANLRKAIPFLESHKTIHAFLDNDDAGRESLARLRESLPGSVVVDQSPFYRNHKDLNDYWRERITDRATPKNRVVEDNAAVQIKRPTPTEKTSPAVTVRRSIPVTPVRKKGRGL